jgi:hypothetical protein
MQSKKRHARSLNGALEKCKGTHTLTSGAIVALPRFTRRIACTGEVRRGVQGRYNLPHAVGLLLLSDSSAIPIAEVHGFRQRSELL